MTDTVLLDFNKLAQDTELSEGFRSTVYKDSRGFWTVGYGLCVDKRVPGAGLTKEEAALLLRMRLRDVHSEVRQAWPKIDVMPDVVQRALVEMAYQMGVSNLMGFKQMLRALEAGDYETAADEGLDSRWNRQTPNRAKKVTDMIRGAGQ